MLKALCASTGACAAHTRSRVNGSFGSYYTIKYPTERSLCYTGEKERFAPRQYREDTGMEYEIDEVRKISIGGVGQKIHIRGEKRTNPVLLFLHGPRHQQPGQCRQPGKRPVRRVYHCCVGSAGTGGSYWGVKKETLNLEQLISDAAELVEYLCAALEKEKLFVWGGSWGTELGTYLCFRYPEHIAGYVAAASW